MTTRVTVRNKETGVTEDAHVQARSHVTNFQAMIDWKGLTKIAYGDSLKDAVKKAFAEFRGIPTLAGFDVKLTFEE
jgi:hypothetical protein